MLRKMTIKNIFSFSFFQFISIIFLFIFALGVLNLHFNDRNDYCLMTYMFEYPQFVKLSVPNNKLYPQYGLYAYSEGRATERARKMWFDGVPVLFLPGNSGSYMQVRSLASVALRKALDDGYEHHFDYFTVDYNEDFSGLYGGVLNSQTEFASECIATILHLYKNNKYTKTVPTSVIIIGHSMGGVVAKRLLAYPNTLNVTSIAIALAAPLKAPLLNVDDKVNNFYLKLEYEWSQLKLNDFSEVSKKLLLSFGNGPRDVMVPSYSIHSSDSYINALTTSVPGVWVSPDHVSIVWCKQFVMAVNKYLFSIIDQNTQQITEDLNTLQSKARQFFESNHSMMLDPKIIRPNATMLADAFWYEDNRRIYQISRPDIERTTYVMIRLVSFPQNRFVAIESINLTDNDWIFGCNANEVNYKYRYCKQATSLTELSRWSGAAKDFGKRKLATIHLHSVMETHPDWSHILVKLSPTRKPVTLNIDINDLASRQIDVDVGFDFLFRNIILKQETEAKSLYYEIHLNGFHSLYQAYLLYVEPTDNCKALTYHVTAELDTPWEKNFGYFHYFTQLKRSPMKLRLYKSNPNVTLGLDSTEPVKVTLLLDPQCTYTISITGSWYHSLAQFARYYTPFLIPYVAAIVLLATRSVILGLKEEGQCISIHKALTSEGVKPYYVLVIARLGTLVITSLPILADLFETSTWNNLEIHYFNRSLLVLPAYMVALGVINICAAGILGVMVFSSQLAHRLLFRIICRGGSLFAERAATLLQKAPILVSGVMVCSIQFSCGAASLVAGAAYYGFMISKMYEEYLEDYCYKLLAKITSKVCRIFVNKDKVESNNSETQLMRDVKPESIQDTKSDVVDQKCLTVEEIKENKANDRDVNEGKISAENEIDDELNNLNFHMIMFFIWLCITLVNLPALLTWARNFKYNMVLKSDTSFYIGFVMSICSCFLWQMDRPRRNLTQYEAVSSLLFTMAILIMILGPFTLTLVNYGLTFMFIVITLQQLFDKEDVTLSENCAESNVNDCNIEQKSDEHNESETGGEQEEETKDDSCDVCSENRIYKIYRNLREKLSFNNDDTV